MTFSPSEEMFFELLRVSLGTKETLSRKPEADEWAEIFNLARRQMVTGICYAGVTASYIAKDEPDAMECQACNLGEDLYFKWAGAAVSLQNRNAEITAGCTKLQRKLNDCGIASSVLKGAGLAGYYSAVGPVTANGTMKLALLRHAGDIDLYVDCGRHRAIEFARSIAKSDVKWDIKHLHLPVFRKTSVEIHYRVEVSMNLIRCRRLQKWFARPEVRQMILGGGGDGIVAPTTEFNLFYIFLHTFRHFLYEGAVFKQLVDCHCILRASDAGMRERTMDLFRDFGMTKFIGGMMWVMKNVFGMNEQDLFCAPDAREGQFILDKVLHGIKACSAPAEVCKGGTGSETKPQGGSSAGIKVATMANVMRNNMRLAAHYPSEVLWAPVWFAYHKIWKLFAR